MCTNCAKVGSRYADQLPFYLRPIIDQARQACNFPRLNEEIRSRVIGGIAASPEKTTSFADQMTAVSLFADEQTDLFARLSGPLLKVAVVAFETKDDSWPALAVFEALKQSFPEAIVLRITHRNGNVQFWSVDEVLGAMGHFACEVAQA